MQRIVEKRPGLCFSLRGGAFTPNIYLIFPPMKELKRLMQKSHRRRIHLQGKGKKKESKEYNNPKGLWGFKTCVCFIFESIQSRTQLVGIVSRTLPPIPLLPAAT
jgi:hypothetical protein